MRTSRSLLTLLAAALGATALTVPFTSDTAEAARPVKAYKGLPNGVKTNKTLVIGIDGVRFDQLMLSDAPHLKALMAGGLTARSSLYGYPMSSTMSGPGWSTIATGVWPDKHKVVDNNFTSRFDLYPDYTARMETANAQISTLVAGSWPDITGKVFNSGKTDVKVNGNYDDDATTVDAADYLRNGNPDSTFVHLDAVDGAGHEFGGTSQQYRDAIRTADGQVGRIVAAVRARATYAGENWLIMVTTDHGHVDEGGHGGNNPNVRKSFVIANGGGIDAGSQRHDVKIADVAATALKHTGVAIDPAWGLDGIPIQDLAPDAFDGLRGSLRTRVDETGTPDPIAADTVGFTHTPPAGWSVDNSAMPSGGVTEWRGWAFSTDEFWSFSEGYQGRESNVRARDVFAVADSDEWADATHGTGPFDSTLVSPVYQLNGASTARVTYASHYMVNGPQTGDVYVSFDGGAPQLLKSYRTANVNQVESVTVNVPAGAATAQLTFRYTGTDSAFWTVDRVSLTPQS